MEAEDLRQVRAILKVSDVDLILLDNMRVEDVIQAVARVNDSPTATCLSG